MPAFIGRHDRAPLQTSPVWLFPELVIETCSQRAGFKRRSQCAAEFCGGAFALNCR
jgi:hypothetical protein